MSLKNAHIHETKLISASSVVTLELPVFSKIHKIFLEFLNGTAVPPTRAELVSALLNVRMTIGGRDVINCYPNQLIDLKSTFTNDIAKPTNTDFNDSDNILDLMPVSDIFTDPLVRDVFGIGTADVSSIQIQLTFKADVTNVASVRLTSWRENVTQELGSYATILNYPQSFSGTGDHIVDTLPRSLTSNALVIIASDEAKENIIEGALTLNGTNLLERTSRRSVAALLNAYDWHLHTDQYVFPLTDGSLTSYIPLHAVVDFRITTTFKVAPTNNNYDLLAVNLENIGI